MRVVHGPIDFSPSCRPISLSRPAHDAVWRVGELSMENEILREGRGLQARRPVPLGERRHELRDLCYCEQALWIASGLPGARISPLDDLCCPRADGGQRRADHPGADGRVCLGGRRRKARVVAIGTIATDVSKRWDSCRPSKPVGLGHRNWPRELQKRVQTNGAGTYPTKAGPLHRHD